MTELAEWDAFVSEALEIRETPEEKRRRLRQLQRDILSASELSIEQSTALLSRLPAMPEEDRVR
jgi:hypothetical protein